MTSFGQPQPRPVPAPNAVIASPNISETAASGTATKETKRNPVSALATRRGTNASSGLVGRFFDRKLGSGSQVGFARVHE